MIDEPLSAWGQAMQTHEESLAGGVWVRIVGGECPLSERSGFCGEGVGHIGQVMANWRSAWISNRHEEHIILVAWNQDSDVPGVPGGGWFAPAELILLPAPTATDEGECD